MLYALSRCIASIPLVALSSRRFPISPSIHHLAIMDSPTFLSGRPSKNTLPMTGKQHAEKFGDSRVSLLDVLKKARPHEITTQALEERAELEPSGPVAGMR